MDRLTSLRASQNARSTTRAVLPAILSVLLPATDSVPRPTRNPATSSLAPFPCARSRALDSPRAAPPRPVRTRMRAPPAPLALPCKSLSQCRSRGGCLHPLVLRLARSQRRQFPLALATSLRRHPVGARRDWRPPRLRRPHQSPAARHRP